MSEIQLLSQETIDKIAAGEVVERPSSVVKELVENAIDAGATAITVEIREGGTSLIRITDNGSGIAPDQVKLAFLRHSTSKIRRVEDLIGVRSLGFRGEALSSISAVSRVELVTKTREALTGVRYVIEGGREGTIEEVGAPDGTTFLVKDLFYNTPARRKFLKSPQTEGNYIGDLVERLALSHPEISFKYINNDRTKLHTSGNGKSREVIYHLYGRDITAALLPVDYQGNYFRVSGFLGGPEVTRGNRNLESYFINNRYIKSRVITKAIEEAYSPYLMERQYPFTVLYFGFAGELLDVNVHPTKMELRFEHNQEIYQEICSALGDILSGRELIREVSPDRQRAPEKKDKGAAEVRRYPENSPEPFDDRRLNELRREVAKDSPYSRQYPSRFWGRSAVSDLREQEKETEKETEKEKEASSHLLGFGVREDVRVYGAGDTEESSDDSSHQGGRALTDIPERYAGRLTEISGDEDRRTDGDKTGEIRQEKGAAAVGDPGAHALMESRLEAIRQGLLERQGQKKSDDLPPYTKGDKGPQYEEITMASLDPAFLSQEARTGHRIIGQLFETYWLVEYQDKLYIIDQHAAHEKVLYEQTMAGLKEKTATSQMLSPPIILTLDSQEAEMLERCRPQIEALGYVVEHFGGKEYQISGVPGNLYNLDMRELFVQMLDDFAGLSAKATPQLITEKVASMSCKAAVKGNNKLSMPEIEQLITDLLSLDNPYNCPHGRPTIISMTRYEIEKSFKRIV